jgi:hypothetical protein
MSNVIPLLLKDGLRNLTSLLGTDRDKGSANEYFHRVLRQDQLLNAFRNSWLPKRIVTTVAFDSVRRWRRWNGDAEQVKVIELVESRLNVANKVFEALLRARLFGGAAIYLVTDDSQTELPLAVGDKGRASLIGLNVLSMDDLAVGEINKNPLSPNFGQPDFFRTHEGDIHPSRLAIFHGESTPISEKTKGSAGYWGDSVLQSVFDQVSQADGTSANIASLIFEAKVDVFKIPNFMQNIGDEDYQKDIQERVRLASQTKGNIGSLLMDAKEEYDSKTMSFGSLDGVLMTFMRLCCGAADIPATRLLGVSPGGLNSTGESDLRNYYDNVGAEQRMKMTPAMVNLDRMIVRTALGDESADIFPEWRPLWQPTEQEVSENGKRLADSIKTLTDTGLFSEEDLAPAAANAIVEARLLPTFRLGALPDSEDDLDEGVEVIGDAEPRPLYVSRPVLNGEAILEWARSQGIQNLLPEDELHVTLIYSKGAVDWIEMGQAWSGEDATLTVPEGGPRVVQFLGPNKDVAALLFANSELDWRHEELKRKGASWDWPEYNPHVTLSTDPGVDLEDVEPYQGVIELGPERFEEVRL